MEDAPHLAPTLHLKHQLRRWQEHALVEWRNSGCRGIVEVATGGGKTVFAEACIMEILSRIPSCRVAIVVPTNVLLDQWYTSLIDELGVPQDTIALFGGGNRGPSKPFNIFVVNTARRSLPPLLSNTPTFLVVDECHRLGTQKNVAALEGPTVGTLGLSATPDRDYDDALAELIAPKLGQVIYRYSLADARRDGITTTFDLINVEVSLLADEEVKYQRLTRRIGQKLRSVNIEALKDLPNDVSVLLRTRARLAANATMRIPVTVKLVEEHRGQRCMVFHEEIDAAETIARNLEVRGHSVARYHSRISPAFRRTNLLHFRRGIYKVLVSCRALDEGVNIPETEIAVIASSSATTRQRIQRLGRVLRPSRNKSHARIYTIFATESERQRLQTEESDVEGIASVRWLRAGASNG